MRSGRGSKWRERKLDRHVGVRVKPASFKDLDLRPGGL